MTWFPKRRRKQWTPARSPGTLIHIGERRSEKTTIHLIRYDSESLEEFSPESGERCRQLSETAGICWIHVTGLHEVDTIGDLMKAFDIHPLIQEDVLNTDHLPKAEDHDDYLFVTLKEVISEPDEPIAIRQFSLLLMQNRVVSFQEGPSQTLDPVLKRLRGGMGLMRKRGADYLTWGLLDAVIDHYFLVLDELEARAAELDELLLVDSAQDYGLSIHSFKKDVASLNRKVRPVREVVTALQRSGSDLIDGQNHAFYSDLYDHAVHAIGTMDALKEAASSLRDHHLAAVNFRMNEVMKVLTTFATIFLPLTFLAGVYGMNFASMPELSRPWAYPVLWLVFVAVAVGMVIYFKRKKWL